jgi:hypothetical protein
MIEELWFDFRHRLEYLSSQKSIPALGPTQPCLPAFISSGESGWNVKLTTHLNQVPRLRMSGATPLSLSLSLSTPFPQHVPSWHAQGQLLFSFGCQWIGICEFHVFYFKLTSTSCCVLIMLVVPANETSKKHSSVSKNWMVLSRLLQNFMFERVDCDILPLGMVRRRRKCL